ncbi:MAG: HAD family hydrolase [Ruminococcaceae bacterium]|nr:HAD family hydrolase [Oscillospiraceae bacterium]
MKNKQHIFFDLDGTLTDPAEGITKGVRYALTHLGISAPPLEALRRFIGPPLKDAMQEAYGLSDAEGSEALRLYREYFSETGIFENELYPDIPRLLEVLKAGGKKLYLATSKPLVYAERIMDHFDLTKYFDFLGGSELSGARVHKPDVISYVLAENGLRSADCVMIGDRKFDVSGGKAFGLATIGVLYGHGSREELTAAEPDALAETVMDLQGLLL